MLVYRYKTPPAKNYMAFNRNRKFRRGRNNRRRRNTKVSVYTRKGSRSQARQIWKNQSQITSLRSKVKDASTRNFYGLTMADGVIVDPGKVYPLINPSGWERLFNTQPTGVASFHSTHCRMGNIRIRGTMSIEEGTQVNSVDIYVLQCKEDTAAVTVQNIGDSGENLMQKSATTGNLEWNKYYYFSYSSAALEGAYSPIMNPAAFKIRAHRSFQISDAAHTVPAIEDAVAVTNIGDANKRFDISLTHPIKLKNPLGQNTSGTALSWHDMNASQIDPTKQLFLAIFVNAVEGSEVFFNAHATISVTEPN